MVAVTPVAGRPLIAPFPRFPIPPTLPLQARRSLRAWWARWSLVGGRGDSIPGGGRAWVLGRWRPAGRAGRGGGGGRGWESPAVPGFHMLELSPCPQSHRPRLFALFSALRIHMSNDAFLSSFFFPGTLPPRNKLSSDGRASAEIVVDRRQKSPRSTRRSSAPPTASFRVFFPVVAVVFALARPAALVSRCAFQNARSARFWPCGLPCRARRPAPARHGERARERGSSQRCWAHVTQRQQGRLSRASPAALLHAFPSQSRHTFRHRRRGARGELLWGKGKASRRALQFLRRPESRPCRMKFFFSTARHLSLLSAVYLARAVVSPVGAQPWQVPASPLVCLMASA